MNLLTGSDVYVKNELFATLDPTARSFSVNDAEFLLVDTVGFLQDLPHNLIEAFKSTLESALNCDLALIVCDATGEYDMQLKTTLDTLREMDFASPYLVVMNKSEGMDTSAFPYGDSQTFFGGFSLLQFVRALFRARRIRKSKTSPYGKKYRIHRRRTKNTGSHSLHVCR